MEDSRLLLPTPKEMPAFHFKFANSQNHYSHTLCSQRVKSLFKIVHTGSEIYIQTLTLSCFPPECCSVESNHLAKMQAAHDPFPAL